MPQLIVRQIEEKVVKKLKQQAGEHGVSMEAEHRRILRETLLGKAANGRLARTVGLATVIVVGSFATFLVLLTLSGWLGLNIA